MINTIESNWKRTLACLGVFLIGLGLYMGDDGTSPLVIGVIVTGIYAIDRYLEEKVRWTK
tara:strand:+ start:478 stop:657 length:180 start_codon:yes stop_codon:yes gene_type:complete